MWFVVQILFSACCATFLCQITDDSVKKKENIESEAFIKD